jgi:hypothetical protein
MADEKKESKRQRNGNATVKKTTETRKVAKVGKQEYASAGRYTTLSSDGRTITDDVAYRNKLRSFRGLADSLLGDDPTIQTGKTAGGMFGGDSGVGYADIADSNNIGYYSYEFPVDALELPASRAEELRFYRLAYDRDPIVGRAIDLHTELPLSKMELSKPKCSSEEYADFVFDEFQRFVGKTKLFQVLIDLVREYWTIGEAFLFIEKLGNIEPCKEAQKLMEKDDKGDGTEPGKESEFHGPLGGTSDRILEYLQPEKTSAWVNKKSLILDELKNAGIKFDFWEDSKKVAREIESKKAALNAKTRKIAKVAGVPAVTLAKMIIAADTLHQLNKNSKQSLEANEKLAKLLSRIDADESLNAPLQITAEMSKVAVPPAPAAPGVPAGDAGAGTPPGADTGVPTDPAAPGAPGTPGTDPGAPLGDPGLGDIAGADEGMGGGMPPMGGGGGGGGMGIPGEMAGEAQNAIAAGVSITAQRELMEMKHLLRLLEKKKELLEDLKEIREKKREELELFSHVTNKDYDGPARCQILPPEQMEIVNEGQMEDGPTIYYKPPEAQKQSYLEDPDVPSDVKEKIQTEGKIPLNQDPMKGSYVIHFARKKSGYELHGRSILQRCIRTVIYREKLRQVQSTLASRNMTPKTMVIAPGIPISEVMALRAHIDEAKADPDYSVVLNYEARWDEIGSEGRLLVLDGEYQHTNSDLAIGLGLSPEILIGEGMYSGNKVQLEIMNISYLQFRDLLTTIIEDNIFKPIAMEKGFYEMDKYGRPRWIYPKVEFSRMALRDSGDLYDMLFNLYAKGSLPVDIIYEFLSIDPEDATRKLEDNLFTVKDSKFNEMLSNLYSSVGEWMMANTDLGKKLTKGLQLSEVDHAEDDSEIEGSGEGV